ncbi:uncharacterized protein B4U80_14341, partial [Leptotrombidium deliense]
MALNKFFVENGQNPVLQEQLVGKHFVDGLQTNNITKTVFEYDGCRYHNCDICNACSDMPEVERKRLQEATDERNQYIKKFGYNLVIRKECQIKFEHPRVLEYMKFFEKRLREMNVVEALIIRDAFFGGRTQNIFFQYKATHNESIYYYDFKSLYPYVCANKALPLQHPE